MTHVLMCNFDGVQCSMSGLQQDMQFFQSIRQAGIFEGLISRGLNACAHSRRL